jgi:hypothetical protein
MELWDKAEWIILIVGTVLLCAFDFPKGAAFYRSLFNLSVTLSLGVLYSLPLWLIAFKPAWTTSNWFTISAILFYKAIFIVTVLLLIKRDRFYFWVIRKLR